MFFNKNHSSFHFWGKKNLTKYQKVSKCYENECLKNFLLLFISLLTAPIAVFSYKDSIYELPHELPKDLKLSISGK